MLSKEVMANLEVIHNTKYTQLCRQHIRSTCQFVLNIHSVFTASWKDNFSFPFFVDKIRKIYEIDTKYGTNGNFSLKGKGKLTKVNY